VSAIVIEPASPTLNTSFVSQRTQRIESKNTSFPHVGQCSRSTAGKSGAGSPVRRELTANTP
jgi:hypothetical protein